MYVKQSKGNGVYMALVLDGSGHPLSVGDSVKTFRGETYILVGGEPPRHEGSTGRVWVKDGDRETEFFPGVIDAKWVPVAVGGN